MLKIGIIDDHKLFRKSLAMLLGTFDNVKVISETDSVSELLSVLTTEKLDIVLLDIQMPNISGYDACRILLKKHAYLKILMISQLTTSEAVKAVMDCGAHGFITKNSEPQQLEQAIINLDKNGFYLGPELGSVLKHIIMGQYDIASNGNENSVLTYRERQILRMIAREMNTPQIATALSIHPRTAETHRSHIIAKTGAKNIVGAILYAIRNKIILVEDL